MHETSRRTFIAASAALPLVAGTAPAAANSSPESRVAADLERYIGFGNKHAGGRGDIACGEWLASELEGLGFAIERQSLSVPFFEAQRSELVCGAVKATVWPQPIVIPTGAGGITGRLVRVDSEGRRSAALDGAIALVDLPFGRLSTALARPVSTPIKAAFAAGAVAVVAITNGPTGKVIALNADGRKPMFAGPVALIAPENARGFLDAARADADATLFLDGTGGHRPTFNFIGRIDRGKSQWLAVSTPRSGWYACAGERGPGVAAWLWLARWASVAIRDYNLAFICNSGHEYENLGALESLKALAPKPAVTKLWLHLGANVAAQDWHEGTGRPLPSVDPQRYLSVSRSLLPLARTTFIGLAGLEAPYTSDVLSAGELSEVIAAGYGTVAGVFGTHRYHHVAEDDGRCVSPRNVLATAMAFQQFLAKAI
ncbi:hypothetical protein [Novosphingobium resinovorum]|uniref:hypothetical protein n=1 Tax=Novosphingobium resinovorum TaxID=158500 RepID=UPI002ED2DCF5|nr:hypothetical protein [Novosphingobium resinovorum]